MYQGVDVWRKCLLFAFLGILFSSAQFGNAADVSLQWDASPSPEVAGYRIYFGVASGTYTNAVSVGTVTTATISGLVTGTKYYFAATAFDAAGDESEFSNEASHTVGSSTRPAPPTNLRVVEIFSVMPLPDHAVSVALRRRSANSSAIWIVVCLLS